MTLAFFSDYSFVKGLWDDCGLRCCAFTALSTNVPATNRHSTYMYSSHIIYIYILSMTAMTGMPGQE